MIAIEIGSFYSEKARGEYWHIVERGKMVYAFDLDPLPVYSCRIGNDIDLALMRLYKKCGIEQ